MGSAFLELQTVIVVSAAVVFVVDCFVAMYSSVVVPLPQLGIA